MAGAEVWLDKWNLYLGDIWDIEIEKAVESADAFVACLSQEYEKFGYRQKEVRLAMEAALRRPPDRGFIIPFTLEPCSIPHWCRSINAGDVSKSASILDLLRAVDRLCGSSLVQAHRQQSDRELGMAEYTTLLEHWIRTAPQPPLLMGSVGEADFAQSLITRVFEEYGSRPHGQKLLGGVEIKRLSDKLITQLVNEKLLDPLFPDNLRFNLARIETTLKRYGVQLKVTEWAVMPPFHGWLLGDHVVRSSWGRNPDGLLHVRTTVRHYTRSGNSSMWEDTFRAFNET